jgi:hypothetical protein
MANAGELYALAARSEAHATRLTRDAFNGFDNMRHGKESVRACLDEAANAFACAAALRARAASADTHP